MQADAHLHGGGIRRVAGLALLHVILGRLVHAVIEEAQLQITGIVRDGRHVREHLAQAGVQEPLIGVLLDRQQVGHRHDLFVSGKVLAQGLAVVLVLGHLQYSRLSFSIFGSAPRRAPPVRCASYTKGKQLVFHRDTHGFVARFLRRPLVIFGGSWYSMDSFNGAIGPLSEYKRLILPNSALFVKGYLRSASDFPRCGADFGCGRCFFALTRPNWAALLLPFGRFAVFHDFFCRIFRSFGLFADRRSFSDPI